MDFKVPNTPEELFRQGGKKFDDMSRFFPYLLGICAVLFLAATSFYSIDQDEVGVIRRFGKYSATTEPGLHLKFPMGIDRMDKVKVKRVFKEEFGFRTIDSGVGTKYSSQQFDEESLMLTGDFNVIDVSWIVQFRIKEPENLLFNLRDSRKTVRDLSESVMQQVIGDHSVSEALTTMKNEIRQEAKDKLQMVLDSYQSGIQIEKLELQEVLPPQVVQASFNEVNQAEQEREKVINQAWKAYNKIIPKASGEALKIISEGEGYALSRVKRAEGDAAKFTETWLAYKNSKDVTRKRLYLETLAEIIPNAGKIYVFEPKANGVLPLMNLTGGSK